MNFFPSGHKRILWKRRQKNCKRQTYRHTHGREISILWIWFWKTMFLRLREVGRKTLKVGVRYYPLGMGPGWYKKEQVTDRKHPVPPAFWLWTWYDCSDQFLTALMSYHDGLHLKVCAKWALSSLRFILWTGRAKVGSGNSTIAQEKYNTHSPPPTLF